MELKREEASVLNGTRDSSRRSSKSRMKDARCHTAFVCRFDMLEKCRKNGGKESLVVGRVDIFTVGTSRGTFV